MRLRSTEFIFSGRFVIFFDQLLLFTSVQYLSVVESSRIMAVFYAVEFPSEDEKSRGPYVVPEHKVKVEKDLFAFFGVLWTNSMGI